MVCAVWLTVKAFQQISFQNAPTVVDKVRTLVTGTNGVLLAALISTYGIYLLASILYADPWHMFHSFPQYIGLAPSFTNILMVYSFCNLHDIRCPSVTLPFLYILADHNLPFPPPP